MTNPVQSGDLGSSADADTYRVAETPVVAHPVAAAVWRLQLSADAHRESPVAGVVTEDLRTVLSVLRQDVPQVIGIASSLRARARTLADQDRRPDLVSLYRERAGALDRLCAALKQASTGETQ